MPQLIQHIDAIGRKLQRDVLCLRFFDPNAIDDDAFFPPDGRELPVRQQVIDWLDANGLGWEPCGDIANVDSMMPYQGQIYLDVPFYQEDPSYKKLAGYLENADGSMRIPGVNFYYVPLDISMKNAEHDEPGFWERWVESF